MEQPVILQGFGQQPNETIGELLELPLKVITNEDCFNEFLREKDGYFKKSLIRTPITRTLYDGITDQILCTKITCEAEDVCKKRRKKKGDTCIDKQAKCVRLFVA